MATVVWLPEAYTDLEDIRRYVARSNPTAANLLVSRLTQSTRQLERFPDSGRFVPEIEGGSVRELLVRGYRVVYRFGDNKVLVIAVRHGARLLDDLPDP